MHFIVETRVEVINIMRFFLWGDVAVEYNKLLNFPFIL